MGEREIHEGQYMGTKLIRNRRKQKMQDRQRVGLFARLYQALRSLQGEIEDTLPDFEEQMYELT
jgi:hypothetical protein